MSNQSPENINCQLQAQDSSKKYQQQPMDQQFSDQTQKVNLYDETPEPIQRNGLLFCPVCNKMQIYKQRLTDHIKKCYKQQKKPTQTVGIKACPFCKKIYSVNQKLIVHLIECTQKPQQWRDLVKEQLIEESGSNIQKQFKKQIKKQKKNVDKGKATCHFCDKKFTNTMYLCDHFFDECPNNLAVTDKLLNGVSDQENSAIYEDPQLPQFSDGQPLILTKKKKIKKKVIKTKKIKKKIKVPASQVHLYQSSQQKKYKLLQQSNINKSMQNQMVVNPQQPQPSQSKLITQKQSIMPKNGQSRKVNQKSKVDQSKNESKFENQEDQSSSLSSSSSESQLDKFHTNIMGKSTNKQLKMQMQQNKQQLQVQDTQLHKNIIFVDQQLKRLKQSVKQLKKQQNLIQTQTKLLITHQIITNNQEHFEKVIKNRYRNLIQKRKIKVLGQNQFDLLSNQILERAFFQKFLDKQIKKKKLKKKGQTAPQVGTIMQQEQRNNNKSGVKKQEYWIQQ